MKKQRKKNFVSGMNIWDGKPLKSGIGGGGWVQLRVYFGPL